MMENSLKCGGDLPISILTFVFWIISIKPAKSHDLPVEGNFQDMGKFWENFNNPVLEIRHVPIWKKSSFYFRGIPLLLNVEINHFPIGGTKVTPNGEVPLFYLWETPHFPHQRSSFFPHLGNLISPKKGEKGRVTLF